MSHAFPMPRPRPRHLWTLSPLPRPSPTPRPPESGLVVRRVLVWMWSWSRAVRGGRSGRAGCSERPVRFSLGQKLCWQLSIVAVLHRRWPWGCHGPRLARRGGFAGVAGGERVVLCTAGRGALSLQALRGSHGGATAAGADPPSRCGTECLPANRQAGQFCLLPPNGGHRF